MLDIHLRAAYRLAREGRIRSVQVGRRILIPRDAADVNLDVESRPDGRPDGDPPGRP